MLSILPAFFQALFRAVLSIFLLLMPVVIAPTHFSYNGYPHPPCDVGFRFDAITNAAEAVVSYKARIDISGMLITQLSGDAGQADLSQQMALLQQAYSTPGGDAIWTLNDGSISPNSIYNAATIGGVRVIQAPSFPTTKNAELVTMRTFTCALEAIVPTIYGGTALWHYREEVDYIGTGGKSREVVDVTQGKPVPQTTRQNTAMVAVQSGEAVGYRFRWPGAGMVPFCANPIWPNLEQEQLRFVHKGSPEKVGSGASATYIKWPTSWRFTFKSADPISTSREPSVWPAML